MSCFKVVTAFSRLSRSACAFTGTLALLLGSSSDAQIWSKFVLDVTEMEVDWNGSPILDESGRPVMDVPSGFQPSLLETSAGLQVLRADSSLYPNPPIYDQNGAPVFDDYAQLSVATLSDGAWAFADPFTGYLSGVANPRFASRMDALTSAFFWKEHLLYVDTFTTPAKTRVTLPIPAIKGTVAIDANGGIHVLWVNADYALWHSYYSESTLAQAKLSDGPVCSVAAVAGEGDVCHVAYSTFSEDLNLNGSLDEGEDVNDNSVLDIADLQLIYRELDGSVAGAEEVVIADTIIRGCHFDLLYSASAGLKLAYANPVENSVRLVERSGTWSSRQISTTADQYGAIAIDLFANGDAVVSAVTQDGKKLFAWEEGLIQWTESLVDQTSTPDSFLGTDVVVRSSGEVVVAAYEQNTAYLTAYSKTALPSVVDALVRPIEIRSALVVTWPTPAEDVTSQLLQCNSDLSDADGWETIEQRNSWDLGWSSTADTTVEHDGGQKFYRVVEISD